jgi:predicted MFS family arabinose efflux permease
MGRSAAPSVAISIVAVLALLGFLRYESRRRDPFIDLRFFHSIPFASATVIAVCAYAAYGAFLFMMSLYLQGARHYSAFHTGLMYLPISVATLTLSPLSGRLVGRFGTRPSLVAAGIMITAATLMLADLTVTAPVWAVVAIFAVFGAGFAMANAPITTTAVSGMPTDRAGAASAVASTSRQVGVSIGVALCGSLAGAALTATTAQYTADARPLWLMCAMLGLVITTLAVWSTSRPAIRSAERLAPLIAGTAGRQESACAA